MIATPQHGTYDVIIIGGAIYGSGVAWFLSNSTDFNGRILVVERDPTYEFASTSHTNSCIRQQFSAEINVRVSQFGAAYIKDFRNQMGGDPDVPELLLHSFGYMYLADTPSFAETLQARQELQQSLGAGTRHLSADAIARQFPFYNLDDILAGNHNPVDEGYFDGATMFDCWRRMARKKGVEFIANEVCAIGLNQGGDRVESVTLASGEPLTCGHVVNASGPRGALTAKMAAIDLPVEPRKRHTFVFAAEKPLDQDLPLTIDPSGVHMRSDGIYYMAGCPPDVDGAVDVTDFAPDHSLWENKVWPAIAHRIPQFEAIKLINSWVGHYAFNTFDQNAVIGPHPRVTNFLFANGFSGHGLQQSPALARGLSEYLTFGEYRSLDLAPFHFDRIAENRPLTERAVI
ncbi:NAD(P)/FAD-dependent oxidoreductase [Arenibacterium sp. CAU 1754]